MDLETIGFYTLLVGFVVAVVGWLYLIVSAFHTRPLWGFAVLLFPPSGLVFPFAHWAKAKRPLGVLALAGVIIAVPYGVNWYHNHFISLGPREKMVAGELHITLTGWAESDYSILKARPATVVLQMANPDVDDNTLEYLAGMTQIRELDISGSRISDEGLKILAKLPSLAELRLARTKITDEGFHQYLAAKESLRKLDLSGTDVKGKSKRDWKKAEPGREYLD